MSDIVKKIGIDLDGVVFNSESYFMAEAEIYDCSVLHKNSLIKNDEPRVQKKYHWNEDELRRYIERTACSEAFDIMPCAKTVIDAAIKSGCEIWFISARGQFNEKEIQIAKKKLRQAEIDGCNFIWGKLDKKEICVNEGIQIMIDDRYDVCETLSGAGVTCLYFHSLGRKALEDNRFLKTVYNWGEVFRYLANSGFIEVDKL